MATGPDHYREAERLLEDSIIRGGTDEDYAGDRPGHGDIKHPDAEGNGNLAAAHVHATLALAAAVAEGVLLPNGQALVRRPIPAGAGDPAYPGNNWGQAIYGPIPTSDDKDN